MEQAENKKTYFVMSDIHSYYTAMMEALDEAGYDKNNENHVFILVGDLFDRGDETLQVYDFVRSIPKERRILVRGNHELLLRDCYRHGSYRLYDESNGTAMTLCHFCGFDPDFRAKAYRSMNSMEYEDWKRMYERKWDEYLTKPFKCEKTEDVISWIFDSGEWVNFFELGKFLFVHSWVPVEDYFDQDYKQHERPKKNWRQASDEEWGKAMWGCPWQHYLAKSMPRGKTIVCGHWHVQDFHTHLGHDIDGYKNREIYFSDRLIALDAMTAKEPHVCNVLVIDGDTCYDKHHRALN